MKSTLTSRAHSLGWTAVVAAGLLGACATAPESASSVLARASQAMGAATLKSLRYSGEGEGYTFGQAYQPGGAWPKVLYPSITRTIDFDNAAMRDEVVLSRAEPRGGGGYPLQGQQRNDQYLHGDFAWNVVGGNVAAGPRFVADRIHQLGITPHGVLKAAARNNAVAQRNADGVHALSFTEPGRYMLRFGWLTVTADDLAIWRQYPEAAFTLVELPDVADDGREQFHLGAFELPLPPMPDEH